MFGVTAEMMLNLSVLLCLLANVAGYTVLYGLDGYSTDTPFGGTHNRPFPVLPYPCPTNYLLVTRNNWNHPEELRINNQKGSWSCYNPKHPTYIIIPGIWHTYKEKWVKMMYEAILQTEPANCILMDWSSCTWDLYIRQIQSIRLLGTDLKNLIYYLEERHGCNPDNVCLIGVNLGAYIAGIAGQQKRVGRIVALEPAGPMFYGEAELYLNRQCAKFVQIIHTSVLPFEQLGFGNKDIIGHMHVFVNGGESMPECPSLSMTGEEVACIILPILGPMNCTDNGFPTPERCNEIMGDKTFTLKDIVDLDYNFCCSHYQAINYYIHSILYALKYRGYSCASVEDCINGVFQVCLGDNCTQLGHFADPPLDDNADPKLYYLEAEAQPVLS